jgi:hypothetical protein
MGEDVLKPFVVDINGIAERRSPPPLSGRYTKIILDASERRVPLNLLMFRYEPYREGACHKHEGSAEIYFTLRGMGTVEFNDEV